MFKGRIDLHQIYAIDAGETSNFEILEKDFEAIIMFCAQLKD